MRDDAVGADDDCAVVQFAVVAQFAESTDDYRIIRSGRPISEIRGGERGGSRLVASRNM